MLLHAATTAAMTAPSLVGCLLGILHQPFTDFLHLQVFKNFAKKMETDLGHNPEFLVQVRLRAAQGRGKGEGEGKGGCWRPCLVRDQGGLPLGDFKMDYELLACCHQSVKDADAAGHGAP